MPFASQEFAWGPYTATYDNKDGGGAVDMGLIEGPARVQQTAEATDVRSDLHGESVIDGIYQGGNPFLLMTFKLWKFTIHTAGNNQDYLWPFAEMGHSGVHGRSMVDLAGIIVLTAVAGTTAADKGPKIRTANFAMYSPKHTSEHVMGNAERDVLIVFRLYPELDGVISLAKLKWYKDMDA